MQELSTSTEAAIILSEELEPTIEPLKSMKTFQYSWNPTLTLSKQPNLLELVKNKIVVTEISISLVCNYKQCLLLSGRRVKKTLDAWFKYINYNIIRFVSKK